jgi:hypothetical protein
MRQEGFVLACFNVMVFHELEAVRDIVLDVACTLLNLSKALVVWFSHLLSH